jgi:hypothetical protein
MTAGRDVFEKLSDTLTGPTSKLRAGRAAQGRAELIDVLRDAGFVLDAATPMDDDALAAAEPHVLVVLGTAIENGYALHAVPKSAIDAELEAALRAIDTLLVEPDAPWNATELFVAYARVALATGAMEVEDVALELENADGDRPEVESLAPLFERWAPHQVVVWARGEEPGAGMNVRFVDVVHAFREL